MNFPTKIKKDMLATRAIDISGPDGNVHFIFAKMRMALRQLGVSMQDADALQTAVKNLGVFTSENELRLGSAYELVLLRYTKETGIQFVSPHKLPLNPEVYVVREFSQDELL